MARVICLAAAVLVTSTSLAVAARQPNFLLIVADDATWRDFGFTGNGDVRTPHLDRLASQGMVLTNMYTPATTCSPSRHALYTGLFPVRSGAYPNHTRVYDGTKSLFTHLNALGYRTALQGKQHVGPPESFPYEYLGGTGRLNAARQFMTRSAAQPWLLVFASHDPHGPWNRGPQGLHDPAALTVPAYLHDNVKTRQMLAAYYREINALDEQAGALLAMLDETDQAENTLVMFVSEQGSSFPYGGKWSVYDNGIRVATVVRWPGQVAPGSRSDALLQYVDVAPTLLAAAGADPAAIDTGCPAANGTRAFDGRSFLPVLTGRSRTFRDYVFSQHTTVGINGYLEPYPMRAVRDARYKYIRNLAPQNTYQINGIHKGEPITSWQQDARLNRELAARVEWLFHRPAEELYDLETDPYELRNLAEVENLTEVKARLAAQLEAWMRQQGDQGMVTELKAPSRQGKARAANAGRKPEPAEEANRGQRGANPPR